MKNTYSGLRVPLLVAIVVLYPEIGYLLTASYRKGREMNYLSDMEDALKAEEEEYLKESIEVDMDVPEDSKDFIDPDTGGELH